MITASMDQESVARLKICKVGKGIDMMKQQVAIMKCAANWQDTVLSIFNDKVQNNINDLAAIKVQT
jgi:hypothetical protein